MLNVEIKPMIAKIHIEDYLKQYPLKEGDILSIHGTDWRIHSLMPTFDTVICTSANKSVSSIKIHNESGDCNDIYVVAMCVLKSDISSIGVEQLNMFKNE